VSRLLPILLVLLLGIGSLHADDANAPVTDPNAIKAHYQDVVSRPEYHEEQDPDMGSRLKDVLSQWFLRLGAKFGQFQYSGEMPAFASMLMTVLVAFSLAGLFYVMLRLTRRRSRMELLPSEKAPGPKTFRPPEFYDREIEQAIHDNDWHTAWLASWRQFLSRLENRHLVEADRTRTNREYLTQLRARSLPAHVVELLVAMVDIYDLTIYGRKTVDEPSWNRFRGKLDEASLLLHLNDKAS
jgi:hypothetical protein